MEIFEIFPIIGVIALAGMVMMALYMLFFKSKQGFKWAHIFNKYGRSSQLYAANTEMRSNSANALISAYLDASSDKNFKIRTYAGIALKDCFFQELKKKGFVVETIEETCDLKEHYCWNLTKAIAKDGSLLFIHFNSREMDAEVMLEHMGGLVPRFEFVSGTDKDLKDYQRQDAEGDEVLNVIPSLSFLMPTGIHDNTYNDFVECLQEAEIEWIKYPEAPKTSDSITFFELTPVIGDGKGYRLQRTDSVVKPLRNAELDAFYTAPSLNYAGKEHPIKPSSFVSLMTEKLLFQGSNLYIFGEPGTGKTTVALEILRRVPHYGKVRPVWMTPSAVAELQSIEGQTSFIENLRSEDKVKNIIIIDEAESLLRKSDDGVHTPLATFMLGLLDGKMKKDLNCSVVLVFNAEKSKLNPAIFRSNRLGQEWHLKPLDEKQATIAAQKLQASNMEKDFDAKKFGGLVKAENKNTAGEVYAKPGFISLSDLVACFQDKDITTLMLKAIQDSVGEALEEFKLEYRKNGNAPESTPDIAPPLPAPQLNTELLQAKQDFKQKRRKGYQPKH